MKITVQIKISVIIILGDHNNDNNQNNHNDFKYQDNEHHVNGSDKSTHRGY